MLILLLRVTPCTESVTENQIYGWEQHDSARDHWIPQSRTFRLQKFFEIYYRVTVISILYIILDNIFRRKGVEYGFYLTAFNQSTSCERNVMREKIDH